MANVKVYNMKGEEVGSCDLSDKRSEEHTSELQSQR